MISKKPFFNIVFAGKPITVFLIGALFFFPSLSFSQNTKGDRPLLSPGPIRESAGRQTKIRNNRTASRGGRSINPQKSGLFKKLTDRKSSGKPAGERATVSPRRITPPRTASQTGRVTENVVKPFVNSSSYSPPARQQVDRSGRTASGRRLVTRQPSRSVNIYEWSGPKPRQIVPERAREERAYSGNRTASGKKIVERKPTGQSRNLYLGSQKFVVNPSPKPQPSENISSRSFRAQRTSRANEGSGSNQSGITARSASRSFVTSPKNNVYWGKFSAQRGRMTTDMYGRPLRRKDFQTSAKEILPSDTVPGAIRQTRTSDDSSEKEKANRTASESGRAWQGDISGKKLRESSADPRRNGPAELARQEMYISGLSGKNNLKASQKSGLAAGAGALMKAGGKTYLRNSAKAGLGAGTALAQINKLGTSGLTKGNIRTSARYSSGSNKQGVNARLDINKQLGSAYAGKMKPVYGRQAAGGNFEFSRKSAGELMNQKGTALIPGSGKMYGMSGGLVKGKGRIDLNASAKTQLDINRRMSKLSSTNNVRNNSSLARLSSQSFKGIKSGRIEPGAISPSGGARAGFQTGSSKRTAIGVVRIYGKDGSMDSDPSLKVRNAGNQKYQKFASARRPGMESGNLRRTTNGVIRINKRSGSYAENGMSRFQKNRPGVYNGAGTIRRSGFTAGGFRRNTIGTVQVNGKGNIDPSGKGMFRVGHARNNELNGFSPSRRPGFESGGSGRSVIGSVNVFTKGKNELDGGGTFKSSSVQPDGYDRAGTNQRSGFQSGGLKRSTIGAVRVYGKGNEEQYDGGLIKSQRRSTGNYNGVGSIRRGSPASPDMKRTTIGSVMATRKGDSDLSSNEMYRMRGAPNINYRGFPSAPRSGFQSVSMSRAPMGTVRVFGRDEAASRQGLYRPQNTNRSLLNSSGSVQRPGFQSASRQRSAIGAVLVPGKISYPAETRQSKQNNFRLQAGDFRRLNNYKKSDGSDAGLNRVGLNIKPVTNKDDQYLSMRQRKTNTRRANVDNYSQLNLSRYGGGAFFNVGSGSPLIREGQDQRQQLDVRYKSDNRKPVNVGDTGKQLMTPRQSPRVSIDGYVVKVKPAMNQNRAAIRNIPYVVPEVGTKKKGVVERSSYRLPGAVSSRDWYTQPLKFQFSDYKVNRKIASNVKPDTRFAHQKQTQTEEVMSFKTRIQLLFSKSTNRNDLQPSNVKDKTRRPGYDPREAKIWYD